ncbi:MAG: type II methionyl aminopeptidase [Nanoarchaeota archaeon]|nr:type II methionyl aminopeptidase [Nanoarchaeota archaeon]
MSEEKYIQAGKIAAQARDLGASLVKDGTKVLDIANAIENKIKSLGGKIAFPVNISINDLAAHYTPIKNDLLTIQHDDYVKIDVGAHVDGWIADTAITIKPSGKDDLIICSEKMLENAIKIIKPGVTISEIGQVIQETAEQHGFNPINNLTGHSLDQYNLHAGISIPNIKNTSKLELQEGQVIAIEPFCTAGDGHVKDSGQAKIFMWIADKPSRLVEGRKIIELAKTEYKRLPFTIRWIPGISQLKAQIAVKQLVQAKALHEFLPLKEISGQPVAQAEHTVIVKNKPIITTKI